MLKIIIPLVQTTQTVSMVIYPLIGNTQCNKYHPLLLLNLMTLWIQNLSIYMFVITSQVFFPINLFFVKICFCQSGIQ